MTDWRYTLRQGIRFGWVGVLATLTNVSIYDGLVRYLGMDAVLANVLGFLVAFAVSFAGHYLWTFREQRDADDPAAMKRSLHRFFVVALLGLGLNSLFVYLVVDVAGAPHTVAIFFMVLVTPVLTFLFTKFWVFAATPASVAE